MVYEFVNQSKALDCTFENGITLSSEVTLHWVKRVDINLFGYLNNRKSTN